MVALPTAIPVTNPEELFTEAIVAFEVLQVPPAVALLSCVVFVIQTDVVPVIAGGVAGGALTVITSGPNVEVHPLLLVTSTVTEAPLVNEVELNVFAEPF